MKRFFSLCVLFVMTVSLSASAVEKVLESGVLKGRVQEQGSKVAIEYATIAVYNAKDKAVVTGCVSDKDGGFKLKDLPAGTYNVVISFLGYDEIQMNNIVVDTNGSSVDLGSVLLTNSLKAINEVEVTADRKGIDYRIDKKVILVDKQLSASSLSAVEVLENVPSVRVDVEGNVTLRGSSGFTVLIDGKPTVLDPSDVLRQTPASTIENIEIITNPSAKYQPDGTGGIINIITKKNKAQGVQGIVNLKAGSFGQYGGDFLLNWRHEKVSFNLGADYNIRPFPGTSYLERRTTQNDITTVMIADGDNERSYNGATLRGGFDWDLTPKDYFSVTARVGDFSSGNNSNMDYVTAKTPGDYLLREWSVNESNRSGEYTSLAGTYLHKFEKKGHELTNMLNYNYRQGDEDAFNTLSGENNAVNSGTITTEVGPSTEWEFRSDYVLPLNEKDKFEAGFQGRFGNSKDITTLEWYDTTVGDFVAQLDKSNAVNYSRDIYAIYSTFNSTIQSFGYQVGLRGEYTNRVVSNALSSERSTINRMDFFPTVHLSYKLPKENQVMLSYTRRIDRPRGYQLEPFITWEDQYNVRQGDPGLKPQYINALEAGYLKQWDKAQFSFETFYRSTVNKVEQVKSVYSEGVLLSSFSNVGTDQSLGVDLMYNQPIFKWWEFNVMTSLYQYQVDGSYAGVDYSQSSFNWSSRVNQTFKVHKRVQFQVDGNYNSASATSQGQVEGYYMVNAACRMDFYDRKLSASVQVRDVLGTAKRVSITEEPDFYNYQKNTRQSPVLSFTLSYRLNNFKQKRGAGGDMNAGSDMNGGGEE